MTINFDLSKPHEVITDISLARQGDFFTLDSFPDDAYTKVTVVS